MGFLFQKDSNGNAAFKRRIEKYGNDKKFKFLQQFIPTDTLLPVLHHVIKGAPQYIMNECSNIRCFSAMYLRDYTICNCFWCKEIEE